MMNQYAVGGRSHVTSGAIATTIPATSGTTVKASASITFTEFSNIKQPLVIKNRCTKDCEPVTVTVNGTEVGVLTGKDQLVAPYDGTAFYTVEVSVLRTETEVGRDYAGYWNVLVGPGR
jgi:hypothetical protein